MSDRESEAERLPHEALVAAGEARVTAYERTAPRCCRCQVRAGFPVLNGLCPTCAMTSGAQGDQ